MRIAGVIVAGGLSSRMGRPKAFEMIRGRSIIARVAAAVAPQVEVLALNANDADPRFAALGLPLVPDARPGLRMPLAGLHAALLLAVAEKADWVLTVPCDTPFLPHDLVARLGAAGPPAMAASAGQSHYLTGLWPVRLLPQLEEALSDQPLPRLQDWARRVQAAAVSWPDKPYDPFFNVNTPEELAQAEAIAAEFGL